MENVNLESVKKELISEILQRKTDKIIEETNAELLTELINNADTVTKAIAIAELGTTYKRTGFHFDKRLEKMGTDIKYLKKNFELSFSSPKQDEHTHKKNVHKLIVGDNYDALLNLLITHKNAIDVIYIDPPYGKDSMGKFASTNYNNALTRDNLLSMLYPRFKLAKLLLAKDGFLCCSIDDKNQAYVKCMLDDIFGEENFVCNAPRRTTDIIRKASTHELQNIYDYLLVYRCSETVFRRVVSGTVEYNATDSNGKHYRLKPLQNSGPHGYREMRPNLYYPIYENSDGTFSLNKSEKTINTHLPKKNGGKDGRWTWSQQKFENDKDRIAVNSNGIVCIKEYDGEREDNNTYQMPKTWLDMFRNASGSRMLTDILNENIFDNPKPVDLIKWCIKLHPDDNVTVLDFFAGSGTTGQAVLELNREDGGNRTFILCTNNEEEDGFIATNVTSKRLKRVMTGKCYDENSDFAWIKKNKPYGDNLEVYDIATINNAEHSSGKSPFDVIDETCYGLKKFNSIEEKIAWICKNFENTQKYLKEV